MIILHGHLLYSHVWMIKTKIILHHIQARQLHCPQMEVDLNLSPRGDIRLIHHSESKRGGRGENDLARLPSLGHHKAGDTKKGGNTEKLQELKREEDNNQHKWKPTEKTK